MKPPGTNSLRRSSDGFSKYAAPLAPHTPHTPRGFLVCSPCGNTVVRVGCWQAAEFGKGFAEGFRAERLVEMCKALHVINNVRQPDIGMPLSFLQYALTPHTTRHDTRHDTHTTRHAPHTTLRARVACAVAQVRHAGSGGADRAARESAPASAGRRHRGLPQAQARQHPHPLGQPQGACRLACGGVACACACACVVSCACAVWAADRRSSMAVGTRCARRRRSGRSWSRWCPSSPGCRACPTPTSPPPPTRLAVPTSPLAYVPCVVCVVCRVVCRVSCVVSLA